MELEDPSDDKAVLVEKNNQEPKMWVIKLLFCVLFLLEMLLNFDSGGTPAVLGEGG